MLRETKARYGFEMRGLRFEGARLTFYIKPDDGLKLPLIMQLLKQTFSLRFNIMVGRKGHVWGERYWSEILWGGPPEGAKEVDWAEVEAFVAATPIEEILKYKLSWDSPRTNGKAKGNRLSLEITPKPASSTRITARFTAKRGLQAAPKLPAQDGRKRSLPTPAT
jgi:hypothetical protein